jgi:hypothetical protein
MGELKVHTHTLADSVEGLRADLAALHNKVDKILERLAPPSEPSPDDALSVAQAAELAGVSEVTIRTWIARHGVGEYHEAFLAYVVSRRRLREYLIRRGGAACLPHAFREPELP